MKLRLQVNSVRLRLKQGEVKRLMEKGAIEESIRFFPGDDMLTYRLELSESATALTARLHSSAVVVEVPAGAARAWAADANQVSLEATQPVGADMGHGLDILVEKDFACLDGDEEQNADTFPNPLAGTKC
jgi:hypothetical protein